MKEFLVRLPWPDGRLAGHANGSRWPRIRATKEYRTAAWALAKEQGVKGGPDSILELTYHPPTGRGGKPDLHNMGHRCKPLIDGIADAMGCDDRRFRVRYPESYAEPVKGGAVLVHISPATGEAA